MTKTSKRNGKSNEKALILAPFVVKRPFINECKMALFYGKQFEDKRRKIAKV